MTAERAGAVTSEDQFRRILDTAPDAMLVVDRGSNIVFINVQTERLFGYSRVELIGQPIEALIPERFRRAHGGHVARFFAHPGVRPMGSGVELFGRRADGAEMAIEVSLSTLPGPDGLLVSAAIRDISERKRLEATVKLNADRLGSAVESAQDALALFDADDRVVLCNSAYRRLAANWVQGALIGRRFEDLLDAWLGELVFAGNEERVRFRAERMAERHDPKAPFDVRTREGQSLRVTNRRTVEGGLVQTIWDLTDDVQREQELLVARSAAESGSAAKSEFLSSMSHELRTPLNAILGFAQLLRRDKKEPMSVRHAERVEQILKGGEHLLRLIDDILDLSRIEAGGISISPEPVSVDEVLEEVIATLAPMAARASVRIDRSPGGASVPMITADRTRFAQILMNYGSNAIKYNRSGGRVSFLVSRSGTDRVRVRVVDTGMGIPADKLDKIFQPFQRAGQETGSIEGTGIGLMITKRLAELMGGTVGFSSRDGEGSEFWVEMCTHSQEISTPGAPEKMGNASHGLGSTGSHRILYVEDNLANVLFMQDLLGSFDNIELATAPTAEMGIELARARPPDVIIMDINLPGISGVDALHVLRTWPETRDIPVIALTAAASERDRQRGEQAGFYRYLTKPVKVDEFEAALESLLTHKT